MFGDDKLDTWILVVALALALGVPLVGALLAAKMIVQWFVF